MIKNNICLKMDMKLISLRKSFYRSLSLIDLINLIAENEDPGALDEIHSRRIFFPKEKPRLRLIEYLERLRIWAAGRTWRGVVSYEIADEAHDITLYKFSLLPAESVAKKKTTPPNNQNLKHSGPNCRFYYGAMQKRIRADFDINPPKGKLEEELRVMRTFQGMVVRHFLFSIREAERKCNPLWSRYCWSVDGFNIDLWLPISLKGNERRKWLEDNIDIPDPSKPNERQRIQNIINKNFAGEKIVHLNDEIKLATLKGTSDEFEINKVTGSTLATVVAEEKSMKIEEQRPAICNLGPLKLQELILRIFNEIRDGGYRDSKIAKKYGLSKSTFSRFAGSHWRDSKSNAIPDLWMNTAQVLATHSAFKELARKSGVWDQVNATLNGTILEKSPNE